MVATRTSKILGPDGQPVEVAALGQEIAAPSLYGVRSVHREAAASGLTPERLAIIMREAASGHTRAYLTLAIDMEERYLHYASQLQTRRLALDAIDVAVSAPEGVPEAITAAVQGLVDDPGFRVACSDLMDGIAKSFSVVEPIWEVRDGLLKPVAYKHRDPRFFVFDRVSLSELRLAVDGNPDGEAMSAPHFIRHLPHTRTGIPIRRGLARSAAWAFLIQSFTLQDWAAFAEVYGVPLRVGRYHAAASADDKRALLRAVRDIASDAAAIIPSGMELEFHAVSGNHGEAVFGGLLGYMDRQISKLIVGQTMTADDGASLGQAKIHNEVRIDILRADCRQLQATINADLVRWFVAMNFGPQKIYPTVEFPVSEPEDITALAGALKSIVPLGLKVSRRQVLEKFGLSEPVDAEDVLTPPAAPEPPEDDPPKPAPKARRDLAGLSAHGQGCRCPSCRLAGLAADPADRDDVDELVDEAMKDWEAVADPLLEELYALANEAGSFEAVLARLDALRLDSAPLRERLARATAIARGLGAAKA